MRDHDAAFAESLPSPNHRDLEPFTRDLSRLGPGSRSASPEAWAHAAYLLAIGEPITKVAEHLGCSRATVWRTLNKSRIFRRRVIEESWCAALEAQARIGSLRRDVAVAIEAAVSRGDMRVTMWLADRLKLFQTDLFDADDPAAADATADLDAPLVLEAESAPAETPLRPEFPERPVPHPVPPPHPVPGLEPGPSGPAVGTPPPTDEPDQPPLDPGSRPGTGEVLAQEPAHHVDTHVAQGRTDASSPAQHLTVQHPPADVARCCTTVSAEPRLLNLNTATREEMIHDWRMDDWRADEIIRWRFNNDGFRTPDELYKVSGFGSSSYASFVAQCRV